MSKEHTLQGLEPDNLLAFLALLGFHRALDHAKPEWRPRICWLGLPVRPRLVLADDVERANVLENAARGCAALAKVHSFHGRRDIKWTSEEARRALSDACEGGSRDSRFSVDLLTALMSDAAIDKDGNVRATPFCAMFGQGHQHFLERLETVPKGLPPKELEKEVTEADLNSSAKLEQALFVPWQRTDRTQSFRWDALEDRRYALRFEDPSSDRGLTVHGANRLASLALPLLTAVPRREGGQVRLYAVTTSWEREIGLCVSWPIWSRPATLKSIVMMLSVCGNESIPPGLGIVEIYRSKRISVGKYFNFTRGVPLRRA